MPNGGVKQISDYKLSRYACYLIVQNGDQNKEVIALGQTYILQQTAAKAELKTLQNFIMLDIKVCIIDKLQMIFLKEKNLGIEKTF
ncbi:MAG: hypothetical protein RR144_04460 [Clostridia bacterium]